VSTEEPLYDVHLWIYGFLPHDFMYPEFCHHQNEKCIVIIMLIACFVLQSYSKVQYAMQNTDFFSCEGNI